MSSQNPPNQVSIMDARAWYQLTTLQGVVTPVDVVLASYNNLLRELSLGHETIQLRQFELVLRSTNELLVFMFNRSNLIGTAQASLVFPGCRPTVWIEKVVVSKDYRRRGLARRLMQETEQMIATRFSCHLPLTIKLTSQEERNAKSLYLGCGYTPGETIRYQKRIENAP